MNTDLGVGGAILIMLFFLRHLPGGRSARRQDREHMAARTTVPGPGHTERDQADLTRLISRYPEWSIWQSQAGRWWATRIGREAWDGHKDPDFAMTVDGDTLEDLGVELASQTQISRRAGGS